MNADSLADLIRGSISQQIEVEAEGRNRFLVFTPFAMEDGDHFSIVVYPPHGASSTYRITDEGSTLLHLSYYMESASLRKGQRRRVIQQVVNQLGIQEGQEELFIESSEQELGVAFLTFLQALVRVSDVTYLDREVVRATFLEDFRDFMRETVPPDRITFNYHDADHDPKRQYAVDVRINHMPSPLFVFAISSESRCRDVTINLLKYKQWDLQYRSVAIYDDRDDIPKRVRARLHDVTDFEFSDFMEDQPKIQRFLVRELAG